MKKHHLATLLAILLSLTACAGSSNISEKTQYQAKKLAYNSTEVIPQKVLEKQLITKLRYPIRGVLNTDYFFTNYVDHDAREGLFQDSNCGAKTYDGHEGTDFSISNFSAMDQGVEVLAAADGVIYQTHDGEFDRQKEAKSRMTKANYVNIRHANGLTTSYYHFKKNSISVKVGDEVKAGDVLGLVGSSGFSSGPHLHFAAYFKGKLIDPFAGACNPNPSFWETESKYETNFRVWASGISSDPALTNDQVKESPAHESVIASSEKRVNFWVHFLNAPANSNFSFRFIRPDGIEYTTYNGHSDKFKSDGWLWAYTPVANSKMTKYPGLWRVEFIHKGKVLASSTFTLIE